MRVGIFAHRLAQRHPTGIGRFTVELVSALAATASADDDLVVASTREDEPADWVPERVRARVVPWPRRPVQMAWSLGGGPELERSLGELDVVHLLQPFPPVRSAAPQVATVHDLFPFEHADWYRRSERWTYSRSISLIGRRASRIAVPSRYVADRLAEVLELDLRQVEVVPLGVSGAFSYVQPQRAVNATCAHYGVAPGAFAVSVGAVSTRKNMITLVRAAAELDGAGVPLLLIGPDGHGAEAVDAEIARLGVAGRVLRTGFLPDDETAALVQSAAVLVHPTLGEGFGFVPLEAMAAHTPVIAAAVSSVPEVVGDAALLVREPSRPSAWAEALRAVIGDAQLRAGLVAAGEQRVANFSWERTAEAMIEIYRDVNRG